MRYIPLDLLLKPRLLGGYVRIRCYLGSKLYPLVRRYSVPEPVQAGFEPGLNLHKNIGVSKFVQARRTFNEAADRQLILQARIVDMLAMYREHMLA